MSKVICDVCGTTYPETASVCPICGCAKNTTAQTAADSSQQGETASYAYVKGGRFSKSNVRKRNKKNKEFKRGNDQKPENETTNKGLVAVVLILLLAIVVVLGYIGVRFLFPAEDPNPSGTGSTQQTGDTKPSGNGASTGPEEISCTEIKLSASNIELTTAGNVWMLSYEVLPADTTDVVTFTSGNPQVATVDEKGKITAVGGGETVITVTCGDKTAECKVSCTFGEPVGPTTEPTAPPVDVPADFVLKLNREDFTLSKEGDSWVLYRETNGVKASDITWTVDDPEVAVVEDGKVTGVNYGDTKVHATIGSQTVSCTVRVRFRASETGGEEGGDKVTINKTDVTIEVGETFMLTLTNSEGAKLDVQWVASEEGFVTIDGSRITGAAAGENGAVKRIEITGTYDEVTYTCVVRVKPKAEE